MIIRYEFEELPPKLYMMQILDNLSKTYVFLWDKKDKTNRLLMTWKEVTAYYNKKSFKTSLRKLCTEGLLSYCESEKGISIELVGWDDI